MRRLLVLAVVVPLAACGDDLKNPGRGGDDPPPYDPPPHVPPCELLGLPGAPSISSAGPPAIALRDLDGDGQLDVIGAGSSSVGIYPGNGDATFRTVITSPIGGSPFHAIKSVAIADLDGDGKLDLVLANDDFDRSAVIVMLGDGTGAFLAGTSYPTDAVTSVAVADLNGDDKPDVVLAGPNASTVKVRLNNGDGTLGAESTTAVGRSPTAVAVADLDADGKPDVIVASYQDANVSILRGNGDGTFKPRVDRDTAANPEEIAAVDLNGDGKPDLVVSGLPQGISVHVNDGSGALLDHVDYATPDLFSTTSPFIVGDITHDGKPDVVLVGMVVLAGNGDGTLRPAVATHLAGGGLPIAMGDVNGDHEPDVMVAGQAGISMLQSDGKGGFLSGVNYAMGVLGTDVHAADLDHDGYDDLVLTDSSGIGIALGKPEGMFHDLVALSTPPGAVAVGDLDFDGVSDLVVASAGNTAFTVLFGNGDGTFRDGVAPSFVLPAGGVFTNTFVLGDVDGDGKTDIVVSALHTVGLFLSNGDGTFHRKDIDSVDFTSVFDTPALGDFNGDGKLDVMVSHRGACIECNPAPPGTEVLLNQGNGAFQALEVDKLAAGSVVADLDGDGKLDLFQGSVLRRGNGDGTFQPPVPTGIATSIPTSGRFGQFVDMTGDGKLDLVTFQYNPTGALRIFPGVGDGTFEAPLTYPVAVDHGAIADVNHDGRLDIVTPGNSFDVMFARCVR